MSCSRGTGPIGLERSGRDRLVARVRRRVALDKAVVIAEGHVARRVEAGGGERPLRAIHQPRVARPRGVAALRLVRVVEVPVLDVVVVVLHARVARRRAVVTRVRVEDAALQQPDDPLHLVALHAVGRVAGRDREGQGRASTVRVRDGTGAELVHRADRPIRR